MIRRLSLWRLLENWKLKLAALGLAVLLWAVVSAEQVTTQWMPVPVEVELLNPGLVRVEGPTPSEVSVRFAGPGRELWELALNRPVLTIPVREVGEGRVYVLDPSMVRIPSGLAVTVQDLRPSTVRLRFQQLATRDVPVRVRVGKGSERRWVLAESLGVSPARVRVSGPPGRIQALDAVETRPLEIPPGDSTFDLRVGLDTAALEGVRVSQESVRVSGRAEPRVQRLVRGVRLEPPAGMLVNPGEAEVTVEGGETAVRAADPARLRVVVPADTVRGPMPLGGWEVVPRVEGLPPGTTAQVAPARVRVVPLPGIRPPRAPAGDSAARRGAP